MIRHTTRRRILIKLRDHGPKTAGELAQVLGIPPGTSANLCSAMEIEGTLGASPQSGKQGRLYSAAVAMLPEDRERLAGLLEAYGTVPVLAAITVLAAEVDRPRDDG